MVTCVSTAVLTRTQNFTAAATAFLVYVDTSQGWPGLNGWRLRCQPIWVTATQYGRVRVALYVSWVYIFGKGCLWVAENGLHSVPALVATIHGFTVTKAGWCWHPLPLRVWDISCLFHLCLWATHGCHRVGNHTKLRYLKTFSPTCCRNSDRLPKFSVTLSTHAAH
jgi:hypothetical protein